jgi:hypothetical protein
VTPAQARREIAALKNGQLQPLDRKAAQLQRALDDALGAPHFSVVEVRALRADLASVESERDDLRARVDALTRHLPNAATLKAARAEVATRRAELAAAVTEFARTTAAFLQVLDAAEQAARQLVTVRRGAWSTWGAVRASADIADLPAGDEPLLHLTRAVQSLARHQAIAAMQAADGANGDDFDDGVLRELQAARAAIAAAVAA